MSVFENVKNMSREEMLTCMKNSGIYNYGLTQQPLVQSVTLALKESAEEGTETGVIAALNNADTDYLLLDILKNDPERVLEGICLAAKIMETSNKQLNLPEEETELYESLSEIAKKYDIKLNKGIVDIRKAKGSLLLHIVTAKELVDVFEGCYEEGIYLSVNGLELRKVKSDTLIEDLLTQAGFKTSDVKALLCGYEYYNRDAIKKTVGELGITNGVFRVLTDKDCIVQETQKKLLASRKASCGKCVFCREGLIQLEHMQKEITEGRGKSEFIDLTKEIGEAMCYSTPCTVGQVSSKIALSAVEYFPDEYEAHIKKKECPAGACKAFVNIYIDPFLCTGCGECLDVCPVDCIEGKSKYIHMIDDFDCTKCGKCIAVCEEKAIIQTSGKLPKLPNRLTKVGRFKKR
ncbi:MAG: NADH-ubiquinone oxidoreductase-F iron-sulfur binding region domain-containing protein [Sharpea porci]